jgi:uncharacterized repeat protein (TIGR01451 family)
MRSKAVAWALTKPFSIGMASVKLLLFISLSLAISSLNAQIQIGQDIDGEASGGSGCSVSLSADGQFLAIGAKRNDDYGFSAGQVIVYQNISGTWLQVGQDINGESGDMLGFSVSLSADGNTVAVGAPGNDGNGDYTGRVRVYQNIAGTWQQIGQDIDGEAANDWSGWFVSLSADGNIVAIGTPNNDGNGYDAGHVRVYQYFSGTWQQIGQDIDGEYIGDQSGRAVSLSADGSTVAIGTHFNYSNGYDAGHVRVYQNMSGTWQQIGQDIDGGGDNDRLGSSVSLSADGQILAIGASGNYAGHVRVYQNISGAWQQIGQDIDGEAANDQSGSSVSLSADGSTVAIGATRNCGSGINAGHVRLYQNMSGTWQQIGQDIDGEASGDLSGFSVSLSADGNTVAVGAPNNDDNGSIAGHVRVYALKGVIGRIYNDLNDNCIADATEPGLAGRGVNINPGNYTLQTSDNGNWSIDSLPIGSYTVTVDTSGNWSPTCPISQTFSVTNPVGITVAPSFGFINTQPCAEPNVSVNMPFMRPGFSNQNIYVNVCNDYTATGTLLDAYVDLELDSLIFVDNASLGYSDLGENSYRFNLGDINPGQCIDFSLSCTVSAQAMLGRTLCMQANLYPADSCVFDTIPANPPGDFTPCDLPWDKSSLSVEGWCSNDSIFFSITNTAETANGDMQCYSPVRLFIDGEYQWLDSIMLTAQETFIYAFLGDGRTWRLEADQHPLHPGNSHPNATVEACGDLDQWTSGLVNILPMDDADAIVDIFCGVVTGSYDPNDKSATPTGVGAEHKVLPNVPLEYMIRFQNTGTDTAFTVVITDTLDTDLDIFSVQSGASSHDYSFRIQGPRVLEWTFANIMLPDSNVNEAASHGFVSFTVNQNPNLANDVEINNTANIYFDFNEPIITNTTSHIIDRNIIVDDLFLGSENSLKGNALNTNFVAYPNPTTGEVEIRLDKIYTKVTAKVSDLTGRVISRHRYQNTNSLQLNIEAPSGMFFVEIITEGTHRTLLKLIKE